MNIYQKLIEVRKEVPYLQKESKGYQFNYTGSSQVLGSLKSKMDELGLLLIPNVIKKEVSEHETTKGGKEYFTELCMEFTWVNAENPEEKITCSWYGQGLDTGEKGVGKAMTYAEKYFMLKFFNIATDKDDPDSFQKKMADEPTPIKPRTNTITPQQQKKIFAEAADRGVTAEAVRALIYKLYNGKIKSTSELTPAQMDELLKEFPEKKEAVVNE